MKGNKSLYVLLPVVFIVWGIIVFRIVKYVGQSNASIPAPVYTEVKFEPEKFQNDTFSIVAAYRDPFLGEIKKERKVVAISKVSKPVIKPAVKSEAPWPTISFNGLIKNKDSKKTYALLTVNGKTKSFSDKDEWQGLRVIGISRDSITLTYNKQKKSFRKK